MMTLLPILDNLSTIFEDNLDNPDNPDIFKTNGNNFQMWQSFWLSWQFSFSDISHIYNSNLLYNLNITSTFLKKHEFLFFSLYGLIIQCFNIMLILSLLLMHIFWDVIFMLLLQPNNDTFKYCISNFVF